MTTRPDTLWGTRYPAAQDVVGVDQPDLVNDSRLHVPDGSHILKEHLHALRDKLDAAARKVGDDSLRPSGCLAEKLAACSWEREYLARGVALSGIPAGQVGHLYDDFTDLSRWQAVNEATRLSAITESAGGVGLLVNDFMVPISTDMGSGAGIGMAEFEGRWYVAARAAFSGTGGIAVGVGSNDGFGDMASIAASWAYVGPTRYYAIAAMMIVGGTSTSEGVVTDVPYVMEALHDFEVWSDGSLTYRIRVDGGSVFQFVKTFPMSTKCVPMVVAFDLKKTTVVGIDKYLLVYPRA